MTTATMDESPFKVAARAAIEGNLRLLTEMASNMDLQQARGSNGQNLLHFMAAAGRLELCKLLVEELGFDTNSTTTEGETPIHVAIKAKECGTDGVVSILRYLLDHGGNLAARDANGKTPLHSAVEHGHHEVVRLLLSKGVPVDPLNRCGTPLHMAALKCDDQAMKILLEHGADPNRVVPHFLPPLVIAFFGYSLKCMKLLVEAGADVNLRGPYVQPVLFNAVHYGLTDTVKFLLEAGADPNIDDGYGKIPIMIAAADGRRELVKILLTRTKQIPFIPDWSVDGIIRTMKYRQLETQNYKGVDAFEEDLKLEPANDEIKKGISDQQGHGTSEALGSGSGSGHSEEYP